jgi:glutathione S-transferase
VLEEKRIPYRVEKINMRCYGDKPNSFLRLQPNGNIPVCIIDGRVYGQSNDIMYALEEIFSSTSSNSNNKKYKSLSPLPEKAAKANELLRLEREVFGAWMQWLTGSARSKGLFVDTLKRVERELAASSNGPFFMGKDVTLVDFMYASFLERMAASLLYFKGFQIRVVPGTAAATTDYPAINRWFDAMETLESYRLTKSDYYTHCWDLPPQLGGCTFERPAHEPYTKAINGERIAVSGSARGSWDLPLQPHNGGVEPDWDWIPLATAKRQAVERVSANHEAIVAFASRGAGRAGFPPVEAPLADPNAVPNAAVQSAIDAILRAVCVAILESSNNNNDQEQQPLPDDATMTRIAQILVQEGGGGGTTEYARNVVDSLSYLRDRIGVPRDMTLPAARQLRAHLNWAIDRIVAQQLAQQK